MDTNEYYLSRQAQYESNARTYPRSFPLAIRSADGIHVTDVEGKTYYDCLCGAGTLALGHNHPVVKEAIIRHLEAGYPMHSLDLTSPVKDEFVEELFKTLPADFARNARIQFCSPSGADAVEASLKLVKIATGNSTILAFRGGWHGQTHGALAVMGSTFPKRMLSGLMPDVHFLPFPRSQRYVFGQTETEESRRCADYIFQTLRDTQSGMGSPAGMILEVVQGEGGVNPAPADWLRQIRHISAEFQIPLIVDEVQTGWGRTGKLYAIEHAGIEPDVLVLSKAIGGGLPLAVIVYRKELDQWSPGSHSGTFRGNVLAMSTGLATLKFIQANHLVQNADLMGKRFVQNLAPLKQHPLIGDIRSRGLMIGIEFIDPDTRDPLGHPVPAPTTARAFQKFCFEHRLVAERGGIDDTVLRLLPPLTITPEQVDEVSAILLEAGASLRASEIPQAHEV